MSAVSATEAGIRTRAIAPRLVLAVLVAAGAALQTVLAFSLTTPAYFPDEYIYGQLGRSLATTGSLRVAGVSAHFLALVEPLLTAPLWLLGSTETAYRAIQVENALVMSLAAVPAYLIARRLRLSPTTALCIAALAIAGPQLALSGMLLSEPFAYPLVLAVIALTLRAVERPTLRTQALLLFLCTVTALTRLQLAVVPACVALAILASGARERRVRATLREHALFLGALAAGAALAGVAALARGFGYYSGLAHFANAGALARTIGIDAFVVLLITGVAVVPSALPGLALGVVKPRSRTEHAFSVLLAALAVAVLLEAALWEHAGRVQTRYLCYVLPLLGIAFALRRSRPQRRALPELAVAAGLAAVAAAVPLNGWALDSAPSVAVGLLAVDRLTLTLHGPAAAAGAFAIAITALGAVGAASARFRRGTAVVLGVSVAASLALLVLSDSWLAVQKHPYLRADKHWVDHATGGAPATMLVFGHALDAPPLETLFWNPSITRVLRAPGAKKIGNLDTPVVDVRHDGAVALDGRQVAGPLVVESDGGTSISLRGARRVGGIGPTTLWSPRGPVRLDAVVNRRLADGRVLGTGGIAVWRSHRFAGWIEVRVHVPRSMARSTVTVQPAGGHAATVHLAPGRSAVLRVAACSPSPWTGAYAAAPTEVVDNQWRSAILGMPRYVADPRACR